MGSLISLCWKLTEQNSWHESHFTSLFYCLERKLNTPECDWLDPVYLQPRSALLVMNQCHLCPQLAAHLSLGCRMPDNPVAWAYFPPLYKFRLQAVCTEDPLCVSPICFQQSPWNLLSVDCSEWPLAEISFSSILGSRVRNGQPNLLSQYINLLWFRKH